MLLRKGFMLCMLLVLVVQPFFGAKVDDEVSSTPPVFKESSGEPVLLRYKWDKDKLLHSKVMLGMRVKTRLYGMTIDVPVTMRMGFTTKAVIIHPDQSASLQLAIKRVVYKVKSRFGNISFDSKVQKNSKNRIFAPMLQILDKPFKYDCTKRGKVSNVQLEGMLAVIRQNYGTKSEANVRRTLKQLTDQGFGVLPVHAVKMGDVFDGGQKISNVDKVGKMKVSYRNRVLSVSKGNRYAVIRISGKVTIDSSNVRNKVKLKKGSMNGWVLFDIEAGVVAKSYAEVKMSLDMRTRSYSMPVKMTIVAKQINR